MSGIDVLLLIALGAIGVWQIANAMLSLGPARRVQRIPTRPVAELAEGPAEVRGRIRSLDTPLRNVEGAAVVVLRTRFSFAHRSGNKTYSTLFLRDDVETVPVELTDPSGTCVLDLDEVIMLGALRKWSFDAGVFAKEHPKLWERCLETMPDKEILRVTIEQQWIEDGSTTLVSGNAVVSELADADDYRGTHPRFRMQSTIFDPLIVSSWPERELERHLRLPSIRHAWVGVLSFAIAATIAVLLQTVGRAGGR